MTDALAVYVNGTPKPQGSVRAFAAKGRAYVAANHSDAFVVWRNAIVEKAERVWEGEPLDAATAEITFFMPMPKSTPKYLRGFRPHTKRPDLDKLLRAVLDALVAAGVLSDDSVVHQIHATKMYAAPGDNRTPGAQIIVRPTQIPESPRSKT